MSKIAHFMNDESGATAIEYGLIAAILSVGIITVLGTVKTNLSGTFSKIASELSTANAAN